MQVDLCVIRTPAHGFDFARPAIAPGRTVVVRHASASVRAARVQDVATA